MKGAFALAVVAAVLLCASHTDAVQRLDVFTTGPETIKNFTTNTLLYARASSQFVTQIHYKAVRDVYQAQEAFINGTYPFCLSDYPLEPELVKRVPEGKKISTLPLFINYISFFHNLTSWDRSWDFNAALRLGPDVIAGILTGNITKWMDPRIVAYNNGTWGGSTMNKWTPANATIKLVVVKGNTSANYWLSKWLEDAKAGPQIGTNYRGEASEHWANTPAFDWPYGKTAKIEWGPHVVQVDTPWDAVNYVNKTKDSITFTESWYGLNYSDSRGWGVQKWDGKTIQLLEAELLNKDNNNLTSQVGNFDVKTSFWQQRQLYTIPSTTNYTAWATYQEGYVNRPGWKSYPLTYAVNMYTWTNLTTYGQRGAMIKQLASFWQTDKARKIVRTYYYRTVTDDMRNVTIWGANNLTTADNTRIWNEDQLPDTFIF